MIFVFSMTMRGTRAYIQAVAYLQKTLLLVLFFLEKKDSLKRKN